MSRPARRPGRLLLRIYMVGLAQLVLVSITLVVARPFVLEKPLRRGITQHFQYLVQEWALLLQDDPAALQASLERAAKLLEARVTLREASGRLIATNTPWPAPPLSASELEALARSDLPGGLPPPTLTLPLPAHGPPGAYATIVMHPPMPAASDTALLVGAVLVCTAITSLAFARTLAGPLQRLAQVARDFGGGKLDTRTGLRRRDELGAVAEAFDEMAGRITHLQRSQRELLANVSHELRTPLARIRVALDLAQEGDAVTARELLTDVTGDLAELERLVEDVLTTAKLDLATAGPGSPSLHLEQVDARALVEKSALRFRVSHPGHRLEVELDESLPWLKADPVLLRRVLDNLLDNAGKYSEPGTTVCLRARAAGPGLQLEVADEGIGIDAEDLARVGSPFFRTDRSRARRTGGVGLGLALARRVVEFHGGTLALDSRPGEGTTVRFTLPAAPPR